MYETAVSMTGSDITSMTVNGREILPTVADIRMAVCKLREANEDAHRYYVLPVHASVVARLRTAIFGYVVLTSPQDYLIPKAGYAYAFSPGLRSVFCAIKKRFPRLRQMSVRIPFATLSVPFQSVKRSQENQDGSLRKLYGY